MTSPVSLPPPLDFYNRPPKELAGYQSSSGNGPVRPPTSPGPVESITLLTVPGGMGYGLVRQPLALTDYLALDKVKFDATAFNAARIVVNVDASGAGAPDAKARLFYSPSGLAGTWLDAGIDLAGAPRQLTCAINTPGILTGSGPIATAARADVYWAVFWQGGDGVLTPLLGAVFVQFMVKRFVACVWTTVVTTGDMLTPGLSINSDSRWTKTGNVGAFQSGCTGPGCLAWVNTFRFGTGALLNCDASRVFTLADRGVPAGTLLKITGEMSWTYAHFACGEIANPDVRLTLQVNNVVFSNVPSGFPPYDTAYNPFEIIVPADGSGVPVGVGLYGDNGECSLSVNGQFRNFQIEAYSNTSSDDCI